EAVAADARGLRVDDAVERDHRDLGGAAADVDHHRAARLGHRHAGADRRGHGFLDQRHVARPGLHRRVADGALLHLGGAGRHADQHARAGAQEAALVHLADEMLEHFLGIGEIGDDAVLHLPVGGEVAGGAAEHHLGFAAHRRHPLLAAAAVLAHGYDRWLVEHDALPAHEYEGIGRAQVDGQVVGKHAAELLEHREAGSVRAWCTRSASLAKKRIPALSGVAGTGTPAQPPHAAAAGTRKTGRPGGAALVSPGPAGYPVGPFLLPRRPMSALICASLAADTIMVFSAQFNNHILPDKVHILNVSFLVPRMRREFGGCAGNIAFNLKLLGGDPIPMATVGQDFGPYREWFEEHGITLDRVKVIDELFTPQAFITTDHDNNQITAFHPGAMMRSYENHVKDVPGVTIGIVSPDGYEGMIQ